MIRPTRINWERGKNGNEKKKNQNHWDNAIKDMLTFPNSLQSVYETAQQWQKLKKNVSKYSLIEVRVGGIREAYLVDITNQRARFIDKRRRQEVVSIG